MRDTKKQPVILTEEEVDRLLKAGSKEPLANAVISPLYWTGMRNSSLCNLNLNDILWDENRVILRHAKRGKTYTVSIPDQALDAIKGYLPYREEPEQQTDDKALIVNPRTRRRLEKHTVNYLVKKYAAKAGIRKRVYAHLLRHTHGTIARKKGLALDTIARQLGHESIQTTRLYAQLADDQYEEEYQFFFINSPHKRPSDKPRPTFKPDSDWSYR